MQHALVTICCGSGILRRYETGDGYRLTHEAVPVTWPMDYSLALIEGFRFEPGSEFAIPHQPWTPPPGGSPVSMAA